MCFITFVDRARANLVLEKIDTYLGFGLVYVMMKILLPRKLIVHFMKAVPNLKFASHHIICHFLQILRKNNMNALFENANIHFIA